MTEASLVLALANIICVQFASRSVVSSTPASLIADTLTTSTYF